MSNERTHGEDGGTAMRRRASDRLLGQVPVREAVARTGLDRAVLEPLCGQDGRVALAALRSGAVPAPVGAVEVLGFATL